MIKLILLKERLKIFEEKSIKYSFIKGSVTDDVFIGKVNKLINLKKIKDLKVIYTSSVIHPEKISDFNNINYLGLKNFYNSLDKLLLKKFTIFHPIHHLDLINPNSFLMKNLL